jgi:hypothetical protein
MKSFPGSQIKYEKKKEVPACHKTDPGGQDVGELCISNMPGDPPRGVNRIRGWY